MLVLGKIGDVLEVSKGRKRIGERGKGKYEGEKCAVLKIALKSPAGTDIIMTTDGNANFLLNFGIEFATV